MFHYHCSLNSTFCFTATQLLFSYFIICRSSKVSIMSFSSLLSKLFGISIILCLANILPTVNAHGAATLLAPIYRNLSTDDVWVYPNSSFDLGARSMNCECFDPSGISVHPPHIQRLLTILLDRNMLHACIKHHSSFLHHTKYHLLYQYLLPSW